MRTVRDGRYAIHYNSDFSGDAEIVSCGQTVSIPCRLILAAVASFKRCELIGELESKTDEEILGL